MLIKMIHVLMMCFSDAKFSFLKLLILRKQRTESTELIRRSLCKSILLHQRQSRITLLTKNKAELLINFALIFFNQKIIEEYD